jgi:glycogen synthase
MEVPMQINKMLITGDRLFINRYAPLFAALADHYPQLDYLIGDEPYGAALVNRGLRFANKALNLLSKVQSEKRYKNAGHFIYRSRQIEARIQTLSDPPDFVLHVFGLYCPFWETQDIPYGMYLDYTMALVAKNWPDWAPFANSQDLQAWQDCERTAYNRAHHLFTMSNKVKVSLIQDYGIAPETITVVGSFAGRHKIYTGEKSFGNQQILFNGGDFQRKGGDLVLAAFEQVRQVIPNTKLVVLGKRLGIRQPGVETPGKIRSLDELQQLFLQTDIVVAPGRCDPFPTFVIEAMNYGVPCIVADQDGMPEIVDHHRSGWVISPSDADSLAEAIISLLGNPNTLSIMSQQARTKVVEQLNAREIANKITQLLLTL